MPLMFFLFPVFVQLPFVAVLASWEDMRDRSNERARSRQR
jgi:hypothetical protein